MKHVIAYNIGYMGMSNSAIILHKYPQLWDCDFPTFAKKLRQKGNTKDLFKWAKVNHVPPSTVVLHVTIWYETEYWEKTIKMINVREYRKHWESVYKKEWIHGNKL